MKLASEQDVLDLISIRTTTQSVAAIGVALETATTYAAGLIGVENFNRETRFDRFTLNHEHYDLLGQGQPLGLLLANGFLPDPSVRLYQSADAILQRNTATRVPSSAYLVDQEKGVVTMTGRWVDRLCTAGVTYDCGYDVGSVQGEDGQTFENVYQDVVPWLRDAVLSVVIEIIRTHTVTANKKDYITDMSNQLTRMFRSNLYPHVRPRYQVVFHMHSEVR